MDQRIKETIINALMNVVDSAPTRNLSSYKYGISQENFNIWLNYVQSTIKITSRYVDMNLCLDVQNKINQVNHEQDSDYSTKIISICQILLNFAQSIIYM